MSPRDFEVGLEKKVRKCRRECREKTVQEVTVVDSKKIAVQAKAREIQWNLCSVGFLCVGAISVSSKSFYE